MFKNQNIRETPKSVILALDSIQYVFSEEDQWLSIAHILTGDKSSWQLLYKKWSESPKNCILWKSINIVDNFVNFNKILIPDAD